ncbi:MAG: gliding motility-associated C-terminal domain-containing protein [Bacteroidia bacterium]
MKRVVFFIIMSLGNPDFIQGQNSFVSRIDKAPSQNDRTVQILGNGDFLLKEVNHNSEEITFFLIRLDACQNVLWSKQLVLNGTGPSTYLQSDINDAGEYLFVVFRLNNEVILISKIEINNGKELWSKKISLTEQQLAEGYEFRNIRSLNIISVSDSGVVIAFPHGKQDPTELIQVIKLNEDGDVEWAVNYEFPFADLMKIMEWQNGDILLFYSCSQLLHISSAGTLQSHSQIVNAFNNCPNARILTADIGPNGKIYAIGNGVHNRFSKDFLFILSNPTQVDSAKSFNLNGNSTLLDPVSLVKSVADSSIVLGFKVYRDGQYRDHIGAKLDLKGDVRWARIFTNFQSGQDGNVEGKRATAIDAGDTGIVTVGFYADGLLGSTTLMKADKNGFVGCGEVDTPVITQNENFHLVSRPFPDIVTNVTIADTTLNIRHLLIEREVSTVCSSRLYPKVDLGNDTVICSGPSLMLTADTNNHPFNFSWNTGAITPAINVDTSGIYYVDVSYNGCMTTDTIKVVFASQLRIETAHEASFCPNDSINLLAAGTAGFPVYWITPASDTILADELTVTSPGIYILRLLDTTICSVANTLLVNRDSLPVSHAGPDTVLCYNQSYTMKGSGGITYKWIPARYLSADSIPNPVAQLPHTQQYHLIVTNEAGCSDTSEVLLKVRPPLEATLSASVITGCAGDSVAFMAMGNGGDSLSYDYFWPQYNVHGQAIRIQIMESGWVKVVLSDGCSELTEDSIFIEVFPSPLAAFSMVPSDTAVVNSRVMFINTSTHAISYFWSIGNTTTTTSSPIHRFEDTGIYHVMLVAYNEWGCPDSAFGNIYIDNSFSIFFPNAFTPGGRNPLFKAVGYNVTRWNLEIYNRWGELIFSTTDFSKGWDGTFKGTACPEGVYVFKAEAWGAGSVREVYKGNIMLVK